jgi:glucan biosynthesis protein C
MSAPTRRYDLDWLRLVCIVILLFYHTGMWFNTWGWHVKNNELSRSFEFWMIWLHPWRMPLLLFISGAGTYMALGKRTRKQFVGERFRRLFIPLLFGMFVVVPPQIYFEHIDKYSNYWEFYKTVFEFKPYPGGSFSWHHLWFVMYLLVYSLTLLPFLAYIRSERSLRFRERTKKILSSAMGMLLIPSIFIFLTQLALRPYFPEQTNALTDPAYIVFYGCFFFFGILFYSDKDLWESVERNRKKLLIAAVLILIPFYGVFLHWHKVIDIGIYNEDTLELIFDISSIFLSWFTLITVIGYGQHYLNKPNPILPYTNEGLYPFYILHQTVIIWLGWYICKLDWSIGAKFFAISFATLAFCVAFYFLLIRPFNVMRLFFGVRKKEAGVRS